MIKEGSISASLLFITCKGKSGQWLQYLMLYKLLYAEEHLRCYNS
jgi:hypothetical protein